MLVKMFHGFCMALADSVPGVSGGTVAFILGFYEKFIDALHGLFGKDNGARKAAVLYLAKLGVGWCLGLCLSVVALNDLFQTKTYFLSSLFLGLTAAAFPFILRTEWWALKGNAELPECRCTALYVEVYEDAPEVENYIFNIFHSHLMSCPCAASAEFGSAVLLPASPRRRSPCLCRVLPGRTARFLRWLPASFRLIFGTSS